MPVITLSNGNKRHYNHAISPIDVALDIDYNLAKLTVAGNINGKLINAIDLIDHDVNLSIITPMDKEGLKIIRYSCTHLLGRAIKQLWPNAKMVFNSVTNNGFYYDIDLEQTLNKKDISILEKHIFDLIEKKYRITKKKVSWQEAHEIFLKRGENYKVSTLNKNTNYNEKLSLCFHEEYIDICDIPHVPDIKFCRYFKIIKISGVYWEGNKNNKMLQRIYCTAWADKDTLCTYLKKLKEATKRDNRKIGNQLNLFHFQEEAPGMVFWHNDGWTIFREIENFIRIKLKEYQYQEVKSPFMMKRELWEKTGHWDNYKDKMFTFSSENHEYCIKPMSCPGHVQIFNQGLKSYRDLPLRMAEFGSCHRNEPSGALHGLMRVRGFTQDDAHIFCTEKQVSDEVDTCIHMVYDIYRIFGFNRIKVKLSTRPKKYIGNEKTWNRAENDLKIALKKNNILFEYIIGEGAFYGPKIEFTLYDSLNRAWQCGTIQLDFSLPARLNAFYIDKNNKRQVPVIIHRAVLGSIERFIGILIEEFSGFFPTWLAPIQVVIMNITDLQFNYAKKVTKKLKNAGIRVKEDLRNEKISFKIRESTLDRIPYMLICGDKEVKEKKVAVRTRNGKNLGNLNIDEIIKKLQKEIFSRSLQQLEE